MKFRCDACGQKYSVADEKVAGKTLKIRCRKCSHVMRVRGARRAQGAASEGPAKARADKGAQRSTPGGGGGTARRKRRKTAPSRRAPPPPPPEAEEQEERWFAVIAGEQKGPMDLAALRTAIVEGRIHAGTYVWSEAIDDWRPISNVASLRPLLDEVAPRPPPRKKNSAAGTMQMRADEIAEAEARARAAAAGEAPEERGGAAASEEGASLLEAIEEAARRAGTSEAPEPRVAEEAPKDEGAESDDPFAQALQDEAAADPFAAVPDSSDPDEAPRETTQMFIIASGVNKRRSPLRIAAAVLGFLGLFAGIGYLLTLTGVDLKGLVPVHRSDDPSEVAEESHPIDAERAQALREQLLGGGKEEIAAEKAGIAGLGGGPRRPLDPVSKEPVVEKEEREVAQLSEDDRAAVAALYQERKRGAVKIRLEADAKREGVDSVESPIDPEVVAKKIGDTQRAFQNCVQQELRRNPGFEGGRVVLTITVLPSGIVKSAALDDRALHLSDVGVCIRRSAKRIVFPSFGGEGSVDFEVPLLLSTGY